MPALGTTVARVIGVEASSAEHRLVVNRETGAWAMLNQSAVVALQGLADGVMTSGLDARVEARLRKLLAPHDLAEDPRRPQTSLYVIYKLTDACNFSCSYCYDKPFRRGRSASRRDDAFRTVLETFLADETHRAYVLFHGGEPLLDFPTVRRVVDDGERRFPGQIFFSIQTNGSLLTDDVIRFLTDHQVGLSVSVDGVTAVDNALRINKARLNPYEHILRLTEGTTPLSRAGLGLHLTITPHNYRWLDRIITRMERDGFRSVSFSFYQPVDCAAGTHPNWDADVLVAKLMELVDLVNQQRIVHCALQYLIQLTLRLLHLRHELTCLSSPCGAGREVVVVYPSGELGPCDSIFDPELLFDTLARYEGARTESPSFRRLLSRSVDTIEPCRSCDLKRFCNGTCPGSAKLATADLHGVDPFECRLNFGLIRALLRTVGDPRSKIWVEYCLEHVRRRATLVRDLQEPTHAVGNAAGDERGARGGQST